MKKFTLPAFIVIAVVIAGGAYYLLTMKRPVATPTSQPTTTVSQEVSKETLQAGGASYLDPQGVYSFLYPSSYKLDRSEDGLTRISKLGSTQLVDNDLTDGVVMVWEVVDLGGKSLEVYVDEVIKTSVDSGSVDIIEPKTSTKVNAYSGFTYQVSGIGIYTYKYIQKTPSSPALKITYAVHDPQSRDFQNEVDSVLSTVELLK